MDLSAARSCALPLFQRAEPKDRLGLCLLFALSYQGISAAKLIPWLIQFQEKFGDSLWQAPVLRHQDIAQALDSLQHPQWRLQTAFPGLVWTVGRFIRRHAPDGVWKLGDPQLHLELFKDELFGIAPKSLTQNRLRWLIYLLSMPLGAGLGLGQNPLLPDGLLPWAENQVNLERELRKKLHQNFEKDLLPLEQMQRWKGRLQRFYSPEEINWIPHAMILQVLPQDPSPNAP